MDRTAKARTLARKMLGTLRKVYWRVLVFGVMMGSLLCCALHPRRDDL